MRKITLLALMGVLVSAGLPSAAEPAAGDPPTKRPAPGYRPALADAAKAAAVQAGAGLRARSGSDVPSAMVGHSGQVAARTETIPSARATSTVQAGSKPGVPSAMAARAGQADSAASLATRATATRVDQAPYVGAATSNKGARIAARTDAGPSVPVVRPAQAGAAHLPDLNVARHGARYQTDVSPSDAMPGASAQAASLRTADVAGPALRSTSAGTMSAKGPAKHVALDAPPLRLKGAARVPARRR